MPFLPALCLPPNTACTPSPAPPVRWDLKGESFHGHHFHFSRIGRALPASAPRAAHLPAPEQPRRAHGPVSASERRLSGGSGRSGTAVRRLRLWIFPGVSGRPCQPSVPQGDVLPAAGLPPAAGHAGPGALPGPGHSGAQPPAPPVGDRSGGQPLCGGRPHGKDRAGQQRQPDAPTTTPACC